MLASGNMLPERLDGPESSICYATGQNTSESNTTLCDNQNAKQTKMKGSIACPAAPWQP